MVHAVVVNGSATADLYIALLMPRQGSGQRVTGMCLCVKMVMLQLNGLWECRDV